MAKVPYNSSIADYITIRFNCDCGQELNTGLMPVLSKYDNNKDINAFSHDKPIVCHNCGKKHDIRFFDNCSTSYCEILPLDKVESVVLHEIPYEYAHCYNTVLIDYVEDLVKVKKFLDTIDNQDAIDKQILYKMVLTYAISMMDAYLGNTYRYYVLHYTLFQNKYFQFAAKGKKRSKKNMLDRLNSMSFQNLKVVTPYFENTFGVIIPQSIIIQRAVEKRNTIIHNSSREKDGYENSVTKFELEDLVAEIESLSSFLEKKMFDVVFNEIIWANIKH